MDEPVSAFIPEAVPVHPKDVAIGSVASLELAWAELSAKGYAEHASAMVEALDGAPLPALTAMSAELRAVFEGAAAPGGESMAHIGSWAATWG